MRLTIYFLIILPLIIFVSKPSYSGEDAVLLAMKLECGGNSAGRKPYNDYFFALTTDYTFQGNRYWIGKNKYEGDVGLNIFSGVRTDKSLLIKGEGKWLKKTSKDWKLQFISKGNKSMFEHLEAGVEGFEGKDKWRRDCKLVLLNKVKAGDAIRLDSYTRVISGLKNEVDNLKHELKKQDSNANQDVDINKSQINEEEIQNLTKKYEKEITLLKNQISTLIKEKNTTDNEILRLTNELEGNDSELDYKSKFEELSLQFESLNDELENITKINKQLDNEITSLKNDVDKKNIAETEDKKIVQQKKENETSEENQNNDNKNVETVSVDIVKDEELTNLDVSDFKKLKTKEIEDILYDSVTFGFYSDGALFESQYSPNSKGNEGQFSISFSENEKYTGVYKVTKSKVCFLLDGTDNWECSLIYKKNKNDKIYYWATKGEIFAKTTHILTKSEYAKIDKNPIQVKSKNVNSNEITKKELSEKSKIFNSLPSNYIRFNYLADGVLDFNVLFDGGNDYNFYTCLGGSCGGSLKVQFNEQIAYLKFFTNQKKITVEIYENYKSISNIRTNIIYAFIDLLNIKKIEEIENNFLLNCNDFENLFNSKSDDCNYINQEALSFSSNFEQSFNNFTSIAYREELSVENNNKLNQYYNNIKTLFNDYENKIVTKNEEVLNLIDQEKNRLEIARLEKEEQEKEKEYLAESESNFKNKTKLFGIRVLDDPKKYQISNKRLGDDYNLFGNTLTEIFEANYGQKLEYNFYDTDPPIKNNAFFDYKIRTTSLNGKEIISSINARADCPLKGFQGCTEFSDQIGNALYEKYGFVSEKDFDIVDEEGNIYTLSLKMLFTKEGEIIISGYDYLDADGLWMSLGINWSEESLMKKFEIDSDSKKTLDTNF